MRAAAFNCRLKSFMYLYCGAPIDSHKLINMGQQSLASLFCCVVLHLDCLVCSGRLSRTNPLESESFMLKSYSYSLICRNYS